MHEILQAPGIAEELRARLRTLEVRTAEIFGQTLPEAARVAALADVYRDGLSGHLGENGAVRTAVRLQRALIDPAELGTPAFWATALGRAIGYWTGGWEREENGHTMGVPQTEAAAILGMSRQGVNDAIKRKRLQLAGEHGIGIAALSVADYMHQRYPLEAVAA